jgi:anti-sigma B factor antagonist
MDISQSQKDDVTVVALAGRFDAQSAGDAEDTLKAALEADAKKILVDMDEVEYISSAGLRVLLSTAKKLAGVSGKLVLCGLKPYVREVFEVAGFTTIFMILPDVDEGVKAF